MVLTEVAVMTVVGVLTYRSLHRVGKAVKAIHVPRSSLLAGRKHLYSDAYMIALPKEFQLVQGTGESRKQQPEEANNQSRAGHLITCSRLSACRDLAALRCRLLHMSGLRQLRKAGPEAGLPVSGA